MDRVQLAQSFERTTATDPRPSPSAGATRSKGLRLHRRARPAFRGVTASMSKDRWIPAVRGVRDRLLHHGAPCAARPPSSSRSSAGRCAAARARCRVHTSRMPMSATLSASSLGAKCEARGRARRDPGPGQRHAVDVTEGGCQARVRISVRIPQADQAQLLAALAGSARPRR